MTARWAGWQRAGELWAAELADALGVEQAPLGELVELVARQRRQLQLARLELAEAASAAAVRRAEGRPLSPAQAARLAGVAERTIFDWERLGLPIDRARGRKFVYVNSIDLADFLATQRPHYVAAAELRALAQRSAA